MRRILYAWGGEMWYVFAVSRQEGIDYEWDYAGGEEESGFYSSGIFCKVGRRLHELVI